MIGQRKNQNRGRTKAFFWVRQQMHLELFKKMDLYKLIYPKDNVNTVILAPSKVSKNKMLAKNKTAPSNWKQDKLLINDLSKIM